jgi:trehalose 6-phosphate synthase/phosphatase
MAQVIIVSNRLPVSVKRVKGKLEFYPSVGGLATGLSSYVIGQRRNKWIGWPGIPKEDLSEQEQQTVTTELAKYNCYPVFLSKKQLQNFYNGYSNSILWPLFHNLPVKEGESDRYWKAYRSVNKLFAEATLSLTQSKTTIWVHDYQLLLVPENTAPSCCKVS